MSKEATQGKSTPALFERAPAADTSSSVYVMWGFFALASFLAAVAVCFTPGAEQRLSAAIGFPPEIAARPPAIAKLETRLSPQEAPKTANDELISRLKSLEEQIDLLTTGSITSAGSGSALSEPKPAPTDVTPMAPDSLPASTTSSESRTADPSTTQTTFGIDLGSEISFGALRTRWDTLRRQHPELARLSPRVSARDKNGRVELRLIAGPFENAADAAKACADLLAKGTLCDGSLFDGQRLPAS